MKIAMFEAQNYDKEYFECHNNGRHQFTYFQEPLNIDTVKKAKGFSAVCAFVNSNGSNEVLQELAKMNIKVWLQRSMGYNIVDLKAAASLGINVWRVSNYSAESVAEHALTLLMAANRHIIGAYERVKNWNFMLDGLQGKPIIGSTVGVIGSGKIGLCLIKALNGLGANVIVFDEYARTHIPGLDSKNNFKFCDLDTLLATSDFISIHAPLLPATTHLINAEAINKMKPGVVIVNAARGPIIDTTALLEGLNSKKIRAVGLDVLEREEGRFFYDRSKDKKELVKQDKEWNALLTNQNVILTGHQAYFTTLSLQQITEISLANADDAAKNDFSKALKLMPDGKVING